MKQPSSIKSWAFLGLVGVLAFGVVAAPARGDSEFSLKVEDKEPPSELADNIKKPLAPKSYTISDGDGPVFEFWFSSAIPFKGKKDTIKESLENIEEITVLGAVKAYRDDYYDFRDDPIDEGLYVMRMAIQPEDGNHMGTAPFDTFALLMANDRDAQLFADGPPDHDLLAELAAEDTVGEHPPIFSLQPLEKADGKFPRLDEGGDDWKFLCLQLPVQNGGEKTTLPVYLVYEGIGDL